MSEAKIYKPVKTAMQSGKKITKCWILEFLRTSKVLPEDLMGWQSSKDTKNQVKLFFDTQEEAISFAKKYEIDYRIVVSQKRKIKIKAYSDNFAFNRNENWTH